MRIDLHIHTVATPSDSEGFEFDVDVLSQYVSEASLGAIAITNHNMFDRQGYEEICNAIPIPVFPGIEINVTKPGSFGHVLIIADPSDLQEFTEGSETISNLCPDAASHVEWSAVMRAFPSIRRWLVIPHYIKDRKMDEATIETIRQASGVDALEVSNAKKWLANSAQSKEPLVVFSDCRPGMRMKDYQSSLEPKRYAYGYSYINCGNASVQSIKLALKDKKNVSVFNRNSTFEILPEGIPVSPRLNVIMGERSSGKTFTLKRILDAYPESERLYIEQFEITREAKEDAFNQLVNKEDKTFFDEYFEPLSALMKDFLAIDSEGIKSDCTNYCEELVVYANSPEDEYSNCPIYRNGLFSFEAEEFARKDDAGLRQAISILLSSERRKTVIDEVVGLSNLTKLNNELRHLMKETHSYISYGQKSNEIISSIRKELEKKSARKPLPSSNPIKNYFRYCYFEKRLCAVLDSFSVPTRLASEDVLRFKKTRIRRPTKNAAEARKGLGSQVPQGIEVPKLFSKGMTSKQRLEVLRSYGSDVTPIACNLLFRIDCQIVTSDAAHSPLSGGQRAEYLLLHKLLQAKGKDVVLIDEPESSFDNLFLNGEVKRMVEDLATKATVFLVTHNNTLGVSAHPDWILYAKKERDGLYRLYSGNLTDKSLTSADGAELSTKEVLLASMEAGRDAYLDRRTYYGIA